MIAAGADALPPAIHVRQAARIATMSRGERSSLALLSDLTGR
jgi:hypothetical protein